LIDSAASVAQAISVSGRRASKLFSGSDWVAEEEPVALEFNGIAHTVMLATPLDLPDFALGFALSEGILDSPAQLYDYEIVKEVNGTTIQMRIANAAFDNLKRQRKTMAGRTGCGLCGAENLTQVSRQLTPLPEPAITATKFSANHICQAMTALHQRQPLQQQTGAVHAAAWCNAQGQVSIVREDVGRHNALDKVIGALAGEPTLKAHDGFFIITSRASFEMVQKCVVAGVPILAAVSAATAFAVRLAEKSNLTLVGFVRDQDLVVYSRQSRLTFDP
jgi:FdhD protein